MIEHAFVICAYKESEYLEACIQSLKKQTVQSKIVICTSTPCEYIARIAKEYDVKLYVREGESDIQDDWNFACNRLDVEWVTVAHQDDVYDEHYVEYVLEEIHKAPDAVIAFSDYRPIIHGEIGMDRNCKIRRLLRLPLKNTRLSSSRFVKKRCLSLGNSICCPAVTYHKSMIQGPIFTSDLKFSLDWDTYLKFALYKQRFLYIDKPLTYYRIHDKATTMDFINNHTRKMEDRIMFRKFWPKPIVELILLFYTKAYDTYSK